MRETFFLSQLQNAGIEAFYSEQGDFIVGSTIFEVGGKNKKQKQIKGINNGYIAANGILSGFGNRLPFFSMHKSRQKDGCLAKNAI